MSDYFENRRLGWKILSYYEQDYVLTRIAESLYLTQRDTLRCGEEIEFLGTFVGDLKHYNDLEKSRKEGHENTCSGC